MSNAVMMVKMTSNHNMGGSKWMHPIADLLYKLKAFTIWGSNTSFLLEVIWLIDIIKSSLSAKDLCWYIAINDCPFPQGIY